ncbi:MAG: P13 family porin [Candidatus Margulisiibacteriota bacterium]
MNSKILFATFIMLGCLFSMAFAAGTSFSDINNDIDQGLDTNFYQIKVKSGSLSQSDRMTLYSIKKKDVLIPFALNWFVGLGLGSYVQGDIYGGTTTLIGESISLAILVSQPKATGSAWFANETAAIAGVSLIGFKIFELVRPFVYTDDYNKKLMDAMNLTAQIGPNVNGSIAIKFSTRF